VETHLSQIGYGKGPVTADAVATVVEVPVQASAHAAAMVAQAATAVQEST
jgi:hypothetical protein